MENYCRMVLFCDLEPVCRTVAGRYFCDAEPVWRTVAGWYCFVMWSQCGELLQEGIFFVIRSHCGELLQKV